jgi:glutathione peroxidase
MSGKLTLRQKLLRRIYPALIWSQKSRQGLILTNTAKPIVPFYSLSATTNDNKPLSFTSLIGKKVLIVNTASNCGYTEQYRELEALFQLKSPSLTILAFPSNEFKGQEPGNDESIENFCRINFGIHFPLMKKTSVLRQKDQHPVYAWLTTPSLNGWNSQLPTWNFSKYLIDERGYLTHFFAPGISPMSSTFLKTLSEKTATGF